MDYQKSLELLGLKEGFTAKELQRQYKKLIRNASLEEVSTLKIAYEILKGNFQTSLFNYSCDNGINDDSDKSNYLEDMMKQNLRKELEGFLEQPIDCPEYVNDYFLEILSLVEQSVNQYAIFDNYIFLTRLVAIYQKLILAYCEKEGFYTGNIDVLISQLTNHNTIKNLGIGDFYHYIKNEIGQKFAQTQSKLRKFIENQIEHYAMKDLPSRYYTNKDYEEVTKKMEGIKKHLLTLYSRYIVINDSNLYKDMQEVIKTNCQLVREEHFQAKYNAIANLTQRMNQEYRKMPGSLYYKWEIDQIFRDAMKQFKDEDLYYGKITTSEIENFIHSRVSNLLRNFQERYRKLEKLMQSYPFITSDDLISISKFLYDDNYAALFDKMYQELIDKLEGQASNEKLNYHQDYIPYLESDTDFEKTMAEYFLVYCGIDLEPTEIIKKIEPYIPDDYVIKEEGIRDKLFLKIVRKSEEYYCDPYFTDREDETRTILAVSGFNKDGIKPICERHLKIADASLSHKVISSLYQKNGIETFEIVGQSTSLASVIYDLRYDELVVGTCGIPNEYTHMFVGKIPGTGIMYSNSATILSLFCDEIYELPSSSYIINGDLKDLSLARLLLKRY